jgi:hypothetical protein
MRFFYYSILFGLGSILFFNHFCFANEGSDSIDGKEKCVSFSISFGPIYSFRNDGTATQMVQLSNTSEEDSQVLIYDHKNEIGKTSYQIGIAFEFPINRSLFIRTGFTFNKIIYKTRDNTIFSVIYYGNMLLNPISYTSNNLQIVKQYYFISLPLSLNYQLNRIKLSYYIGTGGSFDLLTSFSTTETPGMQYGEDETVYKSSTYSPTISASLLGYVGVSYKLNESIKVGFEPEIKYYLLRHLKSLNYTGYNSTKLFTLGANLFLNF